MDYQDIEYVVLNKVATITLNRPDSSNAMTVRMLEELNQAFTAARDTVDVRVIVLAGRGRNFCAGADLTDRDQRDKSVVDHLENDHGGVLKLIKTTPKPVIAAINGAAAGIGSAYALLCDLSVMAENAYVYEAFLPIGLIPDGGANWLLGRQLSYKRAYQMIIEGTKLDAATCLDWGLTNKVVPADQLAVAVQEWAEQLAEKAPLAMGFAKEQLHASFQQSYEATISSEARRQEVLLNSDDSREGVTAFFEKRPPRFTGT
ncbi:MAG: 2-(1,2-epoxy-1,2-dihydrophenyl)acetyl-CoA isomerase [Halieaceae bacterium]